MKRLSDAEELSPACFGLVMATGIVSLAADMLGMPALARALFAINIAFYAVLWVLSGYRALRFPRRFLADAGDHLRGPGHFTAVAATSIVASQCLLLENARGAALALFCVALGLWIVLTYGIFAAFTVKSAKPALDRGISGAWLLAVVATQSIAVVAALLAPLGAHRLGFNFLALSMWLWGGMLYIWMMSLIFYRYTFFPLAPGDLSPPYWINMGAMAISTLAGSLLVANAGSAPLLASMLAFLEGFTVFYWATGTWWIPMLLVLGVWRYVVKRHPLRYDPLYWGAVFPLGMYAASTHEMAAALGLDFLDAVPAVFLYAAMAAWLVALAGLARRIMSDSADARIRT